VRCAKARSAKAHSTQVAVEGENPRAREEAEDGS
jgi:hypothetical protein